MVNTANQERDEADQIIFCVDGVHGFGIEDQDVTKLGCDVFIAGTHKWIFGDTAGCIGRLLTRLFDRLRSRYSSRGISPSLAAGASRVSANHVKQAFAQHVEP